MKRPDLFELEAVVAVSTRRSFRAAAADLEISPSALSHAVASLEKRLGVRLFHRTTRSVSLSAAGEHFVARVTPVLAELAAAIESTHELRDTPSGVVRLATSEGAALRVLAPVVLEVLRRYPELRVDIGTENRLIDIVKDGFDAGIRLHEQIPRDMVAIPFGPPLRFCIVGSPGYFAAHRKPKTPTDLGNHTCIRMRKRSGGFHPWELERGGKELVVEVDGPLTLDSHALIVEAAVHGAGLAYLSEWGIQNELAEGSLVRVLREWLPPWPGLCLYYPSHRHVPASLRALIEVLKEKAPRTKS